MTPSTLPLTHTNRLIKITKEFVANISNKFIINEQTNNYNNNNEQTNNNNNKFLKELHKLTEYVSKISTSVVSRQRQAILATARDLMLDERVFDSTQFITIDDVSDRGSLRYVCMYV